MKELRSRIRKASGQFLYWSGLAYLYEKFVQPSGAIILMYHSISQGAAGEYIDPANRVSPELFERQMAFLSAHRRVVPLSEVVEQIASGISPPLGTVCITFDDGYLDNLTVAAPILEKYRLPATLFLATGYIDRGETQWADTLYGCLERRSADRLRIPFLWAREMDLSSDTQRRVIHKTLLHHLLEASHDERARMLADITHQLLPKGTMPRLTMNWEDVRELRRLYPRFEIGGHTCEHIDLRTHTSELAKSEIDGCAVAIRRELGVEPHHFSFPYGRWCEEARGHVSASGLQASVAAGNRVRIDKSSDRYTMSREDTPRTMTELRFMTSGAYPGILELSGLK